MENEIRIELLSDNKTLIKNENVRLNKGETYVVSIETFKCDTPFRFYYPKQVWVKFIAPLNGETTYERLVSLGDSIRRSKADVEFGKVYTKYY